jgi:hypothetical protein
MRSAEQAMRVLAILSMLMPRGSSVICAVKRLHPEKPLTEFVRASN